MEISDEMLPFRIWCNEMLNVMNKTMCLEVCSKQYEPICSNISTLFAKGCINSSSVCAEFYANNMMCVVNRFLDFVGF
jgi:hypothetical protein